MKEFADHLPPNIRDTMERLKKDADGDQLELLKVLDASLSIMIRSDEPDSLFCESIVGARTGKPLVRMKWGQTKAEVSPANAREMAINILTTAEAAVQDAALFDALARDVEFPDAKKRADAELMAFQLINLVRSHRKKYDEEV